MFGYVRPYKSEMLVREFEQYKAVYCELCRVLGREYGLLARLLSARKGKTIGGRRGFPCC